MAKLNYEECFAAGLEPATVRRLANGIERYAKQAKKLGITVFGGSTCGSLRFQDSREKTPLIVATITGGSWDGGDGGEMPSSPDGLLRGE